MMNRRKLLKLAASAGAASMVTEQAARAARGLPTPKIKDIK